MITLTRSVQRMVTSARGFPHVIRLTPEGILMREKGRRKWIGPLDYGWLFVQMVKLDIERARAEKAKTKGKPKRFRRLK